MRKNNKYIELLMLGPYRKKGIGEKLEGMIIFVRSCIYKILRKKVPPFWK
ncbi:MAG: hypothetical protein WC459_04870 [Patescibacteria group bacterium]